MSSIIKIICVRICLCELLNLIFFYFLSINFYSVCLLNLWLHFNFLLFLIFTFTKSIFQPLFIVFIYFQNFWNKLESFFKPWWWGISSFELIVKWEHCTIRKVFNNFLHLFLLFFLISFSYQEAAKFLHNLFHFLFIFLLFYLSFSIQDLSSWTSLTKERNKHVFSVFIFRRNLLLTFIDLVCLKLAKNV